MNVLKKIILITLPLAAIIFIIVMVLINKGPKETTLTISPPKIPSEVSQKLPIELAIKQSDFSFPDKLPYLEISSTSPLENTYVNKVANNLGFTEEPQKIEDIQDGTIYIWNDKNNSLQITPKTRKIVFSSNLSVSEAIQKIINKQLNEDDLTKIAEDYLVTYLELPKNSFKLSNIVYLRSTVGSEILSQVAKENAQVFQMNFSPAFEYPIFTLNPQNTLFYVQVLKDGTIYHSEVQITSSLNPSSTEYPLKSFDDFSKSIDSAVLISLDNGNINLPDLPKDAIKKISINKVELVYYLGSSSEKVVQPVFLIHGKADLTNTLQEVSAILYLPAFLQK